MIQSTTTYSAGEKDASYPRARYFIAQHVPDIFRREPRNVGVVVQCGDSVTAKFIGEGQVVGEFDGRQLKRFKSQKGYRAWIRHWRKTISKGGDWDRKLLEANSASYLIVPGGEVAQTGGDSVNDVCSYLFSLLVNEGGGLEEALGVSEDEEALGDLPREVLGEFRRMQIMSSMGNARHPIYTDRDVKGTRHWHRVSVFQERHGDAWAIEWVNFATQHKRAAKDRAGFIAYVFGDISGSNNQAGANVHATAIIRARREDLLNETVKYSLSLLEDNADIVDWLDPSQRERFLSERESVALSS